MSVVAGCLLLDGVLIAADTRISYPKADGSQIHVDNAIKLLPYAPGTVIGYVGHVETAAALFTHLIHARGCKKRLDPFTLAHWIPRFLRAAFHRLPPELKKDVTFMVASSVHDRPMVVQSATVRKILFDALVNRRILPSTFPLDLIREKAADVRLPNTCLGMLYTLGNPEFEPKFVPPMCYKAIGSGKSVVESLERFHAEVLFESPRNPGWSAYWFREAVTNFIERNDIASVGGLYPVINVRGNEFRPLPQSRKKYKRGTGELEADVTLSVESDQWVQSNHLTGKVIPLELPWNLMKAPTRSVLFDDLDDRRRNAGFFSPNGQMLR